MTAFRHAVAFGRRRRVVVADGAATWLKMQFSYDCRRDHWRFRKRILADVRRHLPPIAVAQTAHVTIPK